MELFDSSVKVEFFIDVDGVRLLSSGGYHFNIYSIKFSMLKVLQIFFATMSDLRYYFLNQANSIFC